jgi:hypothetical protein
MTARLVFVPTIDEAPAPEPQQMVVVLDTSWRPDDDSRPDLLPLGPAVRRVLTVRDPFSDAQFLLDEWAETVDLDQVTSVDGVAWWYRHRLAIWLTIANYLHWRAILDEIASESWPTQTLVVPSADQSLVDVARLLAIRDGLTLELSSDPSPSALPAGAPPARTPRHEMWNRILRRLGRHPEQARARELRRRRAVLSARVAALREEGGGQLLVLVAPVVAQAADLVDGSHRVDPFLEPIVRACVGTRLEPVMLALATGRGDDATWPSIEANARSLPEFALADFWSKPGDKAAAKRIGAEIADRVAALPPVPMMDGGVDFSGLVRDRLELLERGSLPFSLMLVRRAERMIADLKPAGLILYNEYNRRDFVVAARSAGVPAFAVQHGIIYPGHMGYVQRRSENLVLPTRTFVFGPYEADVLRRHGGYTEDEVAVTGPPRIAFVAGGDLERPLAAASREEVRRGLGVVPGERLLVVSTTHEAMHRRFYWANCLDQLLDGPLPGIHLVFKQHPAEHDDGGYRALVEGISRRAGVAPPSVTVVRDIDLYTLLRAADAHLGLFSTVLTDAVAAGTPNLVATTQARRDLLAYVEAGVAVPVSSNAELREALRTCEPPRPAARTAFLARHMAAGDAPARIRDAILKATEGTPRTRPPGTTEAGMAAVADA